MKRKAQNPAQAGDAVLAFYYAEYQQIIHDVTYSRKTSVHVSEHPDFSTDHHHGTEFVLEFWGVSTGIVNIPLPSNKPTLYDAIFAMDFKKHDLTKFSHVIMKSQWTNLGGHGESKTSFLSIILSKKSWDEKRGTRETEKVDIYRLNDVEKSCIANKKVI